MKYSVICSIKKITHREMWTFGIEDLVFVYASNNIFVPPIGTQDAVNGASSTSPIVRSHVAFAP